MTRLKKAMGILKQPKKDLERLACSYMETDTLHFLVSLQRNSTGSVSIDELPEPYRTDVVNSFEKAKKKLNIKY